MVIELSWWTFSGVLYVDVTTYSDQVLGRGDQKKCEPAPWCYVTCVA